MFLYYNPVKVLIKKEKNYIILSSKIILQLFFQIIKILIIIKKCTWYLQKDIYHKNYPTIIFFFCDSSPLGRLIINYQQGDTKPCVWIGLVHAWHQIKHHLTNLLSYIVMGRELLGCLDPNWMNLEWIYTLGNERDLKVCIRQIYMKNAEMALEEQRIIIYWQYTSVEPNVLPN